MAMRRVPSGSAVLLAALMLAAIPLVTPLPARAQAERDFVVIVGPRSVYPFVSEVIDQFGEKTRYKYPRSDTTDTDAGLKLVCAGDGIDLPDIAMATRPLRKEEQARCLRTGAGDLIELHIGFDAVVLASAETGPAYELTPSQIFLAVAAEVPKPGSEEQVADSPLAVPLEANEYKRWNQIDPELPDAPIRVLVPPRTAVARDIFASTILADGCRAVDPIAAMEESDPARFRRLCETLRPTDEVEEVLDERTALVERLKEEPETLALLPLAAVGRRTGLRAVPVDEVVPSIETINAREYAAARPVYLFVKAANVPVVPGLREFVNSFLEAAGVDGYLRFSGLVPLSEEERSRVGALVTQIVRVPTPEEEAATTAGGGQNAQARLREIDTELWDKVRFADQPDTIRLYLELFPSGVFTNVAETRIELLESLDRDGDGVADHADRCPETPEDVDEVAEDGCPLDEDGDGVPDRRDMCEGTPSEVPVDETGCIPDTDGDSVTDDLDQCPATPEAAVVDDTGCGLDSDGDSVFDGLDECPGTEAGVVVLVTGCAPAPAAPEPVDSDGDGVVDTLDACADTPSGARTDGRGCWVLEGLEFPAGTATVAPRYDTILTEVAEVLQENPGLRIAVEGHSDSVGPRNRNLAVSEQRARAVRDRLIELGVAEDRISFAGFGPDRPIATNDTAEGRQRNRRVELTPESTASPNTTVEELDNGLIDLTPSQTSPPDTGTNADMAPVADPTGEPESSP